MRSPEDTAVLVAVLFKRSGQKRARVSVKTIRRVSARERVHRAFVDMVSGYLNDFGLTLVELDRGGYGLIPSSSLDGAPTITVKRFLSEDLKKLKAGKIKMKRFRLEIEADLEIDENGEEE